MNPLSTSPNQQGAPSSPGPWDFDDPPKPNEGESVGVLILALVFFVLGFLLGAWLW